jgi:hypothetical protein
MDSFELTYPPENTPEQNLKELHDTPYPGRVIVVGFAGNVAVQAYAIMGRSEGSRNRRFVEEDNIVSTEVVNPDLSVGDPELTIYDAMRRVGNMHIVSNGSQTNTVVQYLRAGRLYEDAAYSLSYEPDQPHFTPRITGFTKIAGEQTAAGLSIVRAIDQPGLFMGKAPDRVSTFFGPVEIEEMRERNIGYAIHTYSGDEGENGKLESFNEDPFAVPVDSAARSSYAMAGMLWENLDPENRVAVVAKTIGTFGYVDFSIINRQ